MLSGCYDDYGIPEPYKPYTDSDFPAGSIVPISQIKQIYYDAYGKSTIGKAVNLTEDYVIRGKIISSDATGNIYRSLYIQDASGAIEIKIGTTGLYNDYKVGQILYVKTKGLTLGNYRYMLSIGAPSVDPDYANGYLDVKALIDECIFRGERVGMTSADTMVVNSPDELNDDMLGRLVRFNGLTSTYGTWDGSEYPSFLEQYYEPGAAEPVYSDYAFVPLIEEWKQYEAGQTQTQPKGPRPATLEYPTYAFNNDNNRYYGTALFKFGAGAESDPNQNLLLRSSGYSRFALDKLPDDGAKVNITAIYTKYSSRSGGYIKYQLVLNNVTDVQVVE